MLRSALSLCAVLGFASAVHAGAAISLVPDQAGPYFGGETFKVDVFVTPSQDLQARLLGFDFSQTDPLIHLSGPDGPDADTTQEFVFDFSSLVVPALYSTFPNLTLPQTVYSSQTPTPGFILSMTNGVAFHAGSVDVTLPIDPGTYTLDAANYSAPDNASGARIDFDFTNTQTWSTAADGNVEFTGGTMEFTVVPEPATLALLGIGGVAAAFRRRRSA